MSGVICSWSSEVSQQRNTVVFPPSTSVTQLSVLSSPWRIPAFLSAQGRSSGSSGRQHRRTQSCTTCIVMQKEKLPKQGAVSIRSGWIGLVISFDRTFSGKGEHAASVHRLRSSYSLLSHRRHLGQFCYQASSSDSPGFTIAEAVARVGIAPSRGRCRRSTITEASCATPCSVTSTVHSVSPPSILRSQGVSLAGKHRLLCLFTSTQAEVLQNVLVRAVVSWHIGLRGKRIWVHWPSPSRKQCPLHCHGSLLMDDTLMPTSLRQGLCSVPLTYALHSVPQFTIDPCKTTLSRQAASLDWPSPPCMSTASHGHRQVSFLSFHYFLPVCQTRTFFPNLARALLLGP